MDKEIELPPNYAQFDLFTPYNEEAYGDSKYIVNLPKVYLKSPMFANTVIFSLSDIEKLER